MLAEVLAGAVEDDFNVRRGFAESLGEFFDGETLLSDLSLKSVLATKVVFG